jgi:hypothetical protein
VWWAHSANLISAAVDAVVERASEEKGGSDIRRSERLEELGSILVRAIIERQCDGARLHTSRVNRRLAAMECDIFGRRSAGRCQGKKGRKNCYPPHDACLRREVCLPGGCSDNGDWALRLSGTADVSLPVRDLYMNTGIFKPSP